MNGHCITLEVCSPLGTPLAGDTLWGHIAWGIRWHEGEAALTDWLARYDSEPPLVLSDPLPAGYWPRPSLPPEPRPDVPPSLDQANSRKRVAAVRWLAHDLWQGLADDVTPERVARAVEQSLAKGRQPAAPVTAGVVHAGINRLTGGTAQPDGGSLFAVDRLFFPAATHFEVWVRSPEPLARVRQWFEEGLAGGYGRDAAIGAGQVNVVDARAADLPTPPDPNAAMALAAFTPTSHDPYRGFFKPGVRCGRLGGDFASGALPEGTNQRQKRPVAVFEAGTVLCCGEAPLGYCGRVLGGVHQWQPIRHYALALVLPCRLSGALLSHPLLAAAPATPSREAL